MQNGLPLNLSGPLQAKLHFSLHVIIHALQRYHHIGISFNGGKDSVVMMNLVDCASHILSEWESELELHLGGHNQPLHESLQGTPILPATKRHLTVFHLSETNSFHELDDFIHKFRDKYILRGDSSQHKDSCCNQYDFESFRYEDMMKGKKGTNWDCIILGVRMSDYDDRKEEQQKLSIMCPTTGNWPKMMRIHPILYWSYGDIWEFTRALDLPYCILYKYGYTSIGRTTNTRPNPELKRFPKIDSQNGRDSASKDTKGGTKTYEPAWMLQDESKERSGRGTVSKHNGETNNQPSTKSSPESCEDSTVR
eukprot:CAMPEP_0117443794 /NCGR_PEP_ID=MMETSP0759-20121206/4889_1 /TAXON_ID=63605 /ORGANISM="Percolomonas cosmopolitus, Strain WS" /LENGTH=308 /DNA_ID=CAMNT_0005235801 /DNA_START=187 /DNA_END=1113 /DNA_ORIENTATION=+